VPLDAYEEDQFRRIAAQLRAEDPELGRTRRRHRDWRGVGPVGAIAILVAALVSLPVALLAGLYPLGLVGYVAATLATVRLAGAYLPLVAWVGSVGRRRAAAGSEGTEADGDQPATGADRPPAGNHARLAWGAVATATAALALIAVVSGGTGDRLQDEDPAPPAPAADGDVEGATSAEQATPLERRAPGRVATVTSP
jgi:hypothetical protein